MASLSVKALTAEIETLLSEKNAGYTEYQEKKRWVNELLTIRRNIDRDRINLSVFSVLQWNSRIHI